MVPSIPVMLRWGNNKGDTVTANGAGEPFARDVVIIGGCGHVGLPLGVAFAARGLAVTLYDINAAADKDYHIMGTAAHDHVVHLFGPFT